MNDKHANPDILLLQQAMLAQQTNIPIPASINPLAGHLDSHIESAKKGKVSLTFTISDQYTQGNGVIQGGALTMLLDYGLAFAGMSCVSDGKNVTTTSMTSNFMRPALPGKYRVVGEVVKPGRTMIYAQAELYDGNDKLVATANSPLLVF